MYTRSWVMWLSALALACGGVETEHAEAESAIEAWTGCADDCDDPDAMGESKKGGGAGVGTSSTAAAEAGLAAARKSACDASKATVEAPACPEPERCEATSSSKTCTYEDEQCRVSGSFADNPRKWVNACRLSAEPEPWKQQHCNMNNGPGGKPFYALCTAKATATAVTECKPRANVCEPSLNESTMGGIR